MQMFLMQWNICIAAATFNMIVISSARFACMLSAVKPKQTRSRLLRTSTLRHMLPLASSPPSTSRRFYWWLSDSDVRISASSVNKCEWPHDPTTCSTNVGKRRRTCVTSLMNRVGHLLHPYLTTQHCFKQLPVTSYQLLIARLLLLYNVLVESYAPHHTLSTYLLESLCQMEVKAFSTSKKQEYIWIVKMGENMVGCAMLWNEANLPLWTFKETTLRSRRKCNIVVLVRILQSSFPIAL